MTLEQPTKDSLAVQKFNMKDWIKSERKQIDPSTAASEQIDNFLDERLLGVPVKVVITSDPQSRRVTYTCRGTKGMPIEKMKEYPIWGGEHTDPSKIKEHCLGGKLGIMYYLDENEGRLSITSQPQGSRHVYEMDLGNWWQRLSANEQFPIKDVVKSTVHEAGLTRFELAGVREGCLGNPVDLANKLGQIYGPVIEKGLLEIQIQNISKGGKVTKIDVLASTIPFLDDQVKFEEVTLKGGIIVGISWGILDQERKRKDVGTRNGYFSQIANSNVEMGTFVQGDHIYYYYQGRLLEVRELGKLKIPGHRDRLSLDSFVVVVNIQEGWVSKTILKSGLSSTAPESKIIDEEVVSLVKDDVAALARDKDEILELKHSEKIRVANSEFAAVLNSMFGNNSMRLISVLGFLKPGVELSSSKERAQKEALRNKFRTIPGVNKVTVLEERKRKKGRRETDIYIDPIPEFSVKVFSEIFPPSKFAKDENGKPMIELNYNNPVVRFAFTQRGKIFVNFCLDAGARALFSQKWLIAEPDDPERFLEGVENDVANFMSIASRLGKV